MCNEKPVLNVSFQEFLYTKVNNHPINTYSKAKNSLHTTWRSSFRYVFIVFFSKNQMLYIENSLKYNNIFKRFFVHNFHTLIYLVIFQTLIFIESSAPKTVVLCKEDFCIWYECSPPPIVLIGPPSIPCRPSSNPCSLFYLTLISPTLGLYILSLF